MSVRKLLALTSLLLFGMIGVLALFKKGAVTSIEPISIPIPLEIDLNQEIQRVTPAVAPDPHPVFLDNDKASSLVNLPDTNRVEELFNKSGQKLPIVETITYQSHVPWQKGRPAWLSDYASHYHTSRHFIARSLNGEADYLKQELAEGDTFNVLRNDKNIAFHLLVDTSRCRLWLYYVDVDVNEYVLLKTYPIGLGRLDSSKTSGLLTPLGKYTLGQRVATFKPKMMGMYRGKTVEMITVFGTRWIPFEKQVEGCTSPAKGLGIHGTPWIRESEEKLIDNRIGLREYESDGCIRLATPDMEELFAIIITKPTVIEIVRDFMDSQR